MMKAMLRLNGYETLQKNGLSLIPVLGAAVALQLYIEIPEHVVLVALGVLGVTAGIATYVKEVSNRSYEFLRCLPVRRSTIWFGHLIDGFGSVTVLALLLMIPQIVRPGSGGDGSSPAFFVDRWHLLAGGGAILFWCGALVSMFHRHFVIGPQGFAAMGVAMVVPIGAVITVVEVLRQAMLSPRALELVPTLLLTGTLMLVASYLLFAVAAKHLSTLRYTLLYFLPAFLLAGLVFVVCFERDIRAWARFDTANIEQIFSLKVRLDQEGGPHVVASVSAARSGSHTVSVNGRSGEFFDLGRMLMELGIQQDPPGQLTAQTVFPDGRLFPEVEQRTLVRIDLEGRSTRILARESYAEGDGELSPQLWSDDGAYLLAFRQRMNEERRGSRCVVLDDRGQELLSLAPMGGAQLYGHKLLGLTVSPNGEEPGSDTDSATPYLVVDIPTGKRRSFALDGTPVRFSLDLEQVVVVRHRVDGPQVRESLWLQQVGSAEAQQLVGEEEFAPQPLDATVRYWRRPQLPQLQQAGHDGGPTLVSPDLGRILWVRSSTDAEGILYQIKQLDRTSGQVRVLVEKRWPLSAALDSSTRPPGLFLMRLAAGAPAVVYREGSTTHLLDLVSGTASVMLVEPADGRWGNPEDEQDKPRLQYSQVLFSPSGRRAAAWVRLVTEGGNDQDQRGAILVQGADGTEEAYRSSGPISDVQWLDEESLVFVEGEREIMKLAATSHEVTSLFPSGG